MFAASKTGAQAAAVVTDNKFNYVTMLLHGDGTNGAQNNTFLDSSSNAFTITRNGTATQGSFSPYGTLWSNYFNGSSYFTLGSSSTLALGSGNFTVELWINPSSVSVSQNIILDWRSANNNNLVFWLNNATVNWRVNTLSPIAAGTIVPNVWTHLAVVRNSGTTTLYINGVSTASFADSNTYLIDNLKIAKAWDANYWNGYLSNVRIVVGSAVYTSNFTPSTTPLTAISGTSLLTCQSNRFIDNSSNAFAITVNGSPSVQRFSPFEPTSAYSTSVIGGSGYFNGSGSDYLTVSSAPSAGTGDFTLEAWVYPTSTADQNIATRFTGNNQLRLNYNGTTIGSVTLIVSGSVRINSAGTAVKVNAWNHVAAVREGTTCRIYVNGVQQGTGTSSSTFAIETIGGYLAPPLQNAFNGYISDLRFVTGTCLYPSGTTFTPPTAPLTAITNTSLLLNTTNAGVYDSAAMTNNITVDNVQVSSTVVKYGTGSIKFDNVGDYLAFPARNELTLGTGPYTIECWVYNSELVNSNTLFTWWNSGIDRRNVHIGSTNINYASQSTLFISAAHGMVINQWYHIALCYDGTTTRIFVNGVVKGTYTGTQMFTTDAPFYIGAGGSSLTTDYFYGYIDDFRITKGYARYTSAFTPPTAALPDY